jgi:hypothetical protein
MTDQPGMTPRDQWAETAVHQASTYSCGKCGQRFPDPQAVYDHLDTEHPDPAKEGERT